MGIRDEEINRLVRYAEGMGVKVRFNQTSLDDVAQWTLDGTEITVFMKNNKSKTDVILSLIHELGHHVWFIHEKNRQPDLKFDEAISRQNLHYDLVIDTPAPKKLREKILSVEIAGTKYWDIIVKETDIKIPKWKIYAAMEFDIWAYQYFVENGTFPIGKVKKDKAKEIDAKHKGTSYE